MPSMAAPIARSLMAGQANVACSALLLFNTGVRQGIVRRGMQSTLSKRTSYRIAALDRTPLSDVLGLLSDLDLTRCLTALVPLVRRLSRSTRGLQRLSLRHPHYYRAKAGGGHKPADSARPRTQHPVHSCAPSDLTNAHTTSYSTQTRPSLIKRIIMPSHHPFSPQSPQPVPPLPIIRGVWGVAEEPQTPERPKVRAPRGRSQVASIKHELRAVRFSLVRAYSHPSCVVSPWYAGMDIRREEKQPICQGINLRSHG